MSDDLSARLVAMPSWRWMPGMLGLDNALGGRARVLAVDDTGVPVEWAFQEPEARQRQGASVLWQRITAYGTPGWAFETWASFFPDLSDPATGGCLLAMLGAGWMAHHTPAGGWSVWPSDGAETYMGPSLGEACARALLAVAS